MPLEIPQPVQHILLLDAIMEYLRIVVKRQ